MEDHKWALHFCVQMNSNHNGGKMGSFLKKYPWAVNKFLNIKAGSFKAVNNFFGQQNYKIYFKNKYQKQYWMESGHTFIK